MIVNSIKISIKGKSIGKTQNVLGAGAKKVEKLFIEKMPIKIFE